VGPKIGLRRCRKERNIYPCPEVRTLYTFSSNLYLLMIHLKKIFSFNMRNSRREIGTLQVIHMTQT
jgi:hypothetical protein